MNRTMLAWLAIVLSGAIVVSTQLAVGQSDPFAKGPPAGERPRTVEPNDPFAAESPGDAKPPGSNPMQPFKGKFVNVMLRQGYLNGAPLLLEDATFTNLPVGVMLVGQRFGNTLYVRMDEVVVLEAMTREEAKARFRDQVMEQDLQSQEH